MLGIDNFGTKSSLLSGAKDIKEDDRGFFEKAYDGIKEAVVDTVDVFQGKGEDSIKFGSYVSPEKRAIYNKMMKEAKVGAFDKALDGFMKYGPAGLGLGLASGSLGMLQGLGSAIQNNKETKNEAAQKVEETIREQRQDMKEHLGDFKDNHRK